MEQFAMGIRIGNNINEQVAEDPNENYQEHDEHNNSSSNSNSNPNEEAEIKNIDSNNSYVVKVKMNSDDSSTVQVNINVEDNNNASSQRDRVSSQHSKRLSKEEEEKNSLHEEKEDDDHEEEQGPNKEGGKMEEKQYEDDSNASDEDSMDERESKTEPIQEVNQSQFDDILSYYKTLREKHNIDNPWEDPEYGSDPNLFSKTGELDENFAQNYKIEFTRMGFEDDNANFFTYENTSHNLNFEFKIKRGLLNDKFFLGAFIMLFRRREEFFTNLILDYENIKDNINAGFCGFSFFINGEWKNITIDTRIPFHQNDEASLSTTESKNSFWMCMLEKAYSKAFKTYDVLNGILVNDYLVDLTGGWSRLKPIDKEIGKDESKKKGLFEEICKALKLKYLIGCMRFEEKELTDELDASKSDDGGEDEGIAFNCMQNILDAQENSGIKLIYLVNYWPKGKWTGPFSVEDETWEANKALAEKLKYQVSQSDGTYWMSFDEWIENFNRLYFCRIFPENWTQFYIAGQWSSVTSGGAPPKNLPWAPEVVVADKMTGGGGFKSEKSMMNQVSSSLATSVQKKKTVIYAGGSAQTQALHFNQTPGLKSGIPHSGDTDSLMKSNQFGSTIMKPNRLMFTPSSTKNDFGKSGLLNQSKTNLSSNPANISSALKPPVEVEKKPKKVMKEAMVKKEYIKRVIVTDTEDRWYLNPQYKLEMGVGTKLIISLIQEDKKLQDNAYLKCSFLLIYMKGRYSRVWDLDEEMIIKSAQDDEEGVSNREIIIQLDYYEALKSFNEKIKTKFQKGEKLQINLIPYIDYNAKYEIEKKGMIGNFRTYALEAVFWLRVFSSTQLFFIELPPPYECPMIGQWLKDQTAGGARFITEKGRTFENSKWPMNPQFLLTFDSNIQMKIIVKKTTGYFSNKENKIGFILTKPEIEDDEHINLKQKNKNNFAKTFTSGAIKNKLKTEQISRVMETTTRILNKKQATLEDVYPKLFINSSEWIIESSYSNAYCACIFKRFKKIDSPIIIIPTLDNPDIHFEYEIKIYSNRSTHIYPLNNENCKLLMGEWKEGKCGGCHLSQNEKKFSRKAESTVSKSFLSWYDNPKFNLAFDSKEKIDFVEFEIVITRCDSLWKPIIAKGVINSMLGVYLFEYDQTKWREKCVNYATIDFLPKNEMKIKFEFENIDPRGFIIMPVTYGRNVKGPFIIMIKCRKKFFLTKMDDNFN